MSVGKYSPTVSSSYALDQKWYERNGGGWGNGKFPNREEDDDGFDSYGYAGPDGCGPDRAGHTEDDYLTTAEHQGDNYVHTLYESVDQEWSGRLLGDLVDYRSQAILAQEAGLSERDIDLYREFALKDVRTIWRGYRFFVHKDDLPGLVEYYRKRFFRG